MQWVDRGFVLAARPHGENAVVLELFTAEHGRHLGLVHGGQSPRRRASLQPGNAVEAKWRARLPEHLGTFGCELLCAYAARLLDDPARLLALSAAMAILSVSLPERQPDRDLFAATEALLGALDAEAKWAQPYLLWEQRLLAALGFGIPRGGPRTPGIGVGEKRAQIPEGSTPAARSSQGGIDAGIRLTGHLLLREVLAPQGRGLPVARKRLALLLRRAEAGGEVGAAGEELAS
jgi:DNA repair protein RecO (recombination protein O)